MASSSSIPLASPKDFPLALQLEWYKIRDTFFGDNNVKQNIPLALMLAVSCKHPDAQWLTKVCAGRNVNNEEDAKKVFTAVGQNDARALCFTWLCGTWTEQRDLAMLNRSAELGFAFATALLARETKNLRFYLAQLSASQGEREGCFWLAISLRYGHGCEKDLVKAKETFLHASELGHVVSLIHLGYLFDELDPQRWRWWGRAAALGDSSRFLSYLKHQVELFNSGSGSAAVVFAIGEASQGHINEETRKIFNSDYDLDWHIVPVNQAIAFYQSQLEASRRAVDEWTKVALRFRVCKDIRILIGRIIWSARDQALY